MIQGTLLVANYVIRSFFMLNRAHCNKLISIVWNVLEFANKVNYKFSQFFVFATDLLVLGI